MAGSPSSNGVMIGGKATYDRALGNRGTDRLGLKMRESWAVTIIARKQLS